MDDLNLKQFYKNNGFAIQSDPIIPIDLLDKASSRIPKIISEEYDMGFPPSRRWNVGDNKKVQKIDQVHRCDNAFFNLVTYSKLYESVAQICGAKTLQVWGTQLIIKPAGGEGLGNIGWHSDEVNWYWLGGNLFTIWVPLVDVSESSGAIGYISESHAWDLELEVEDAYDQDMSILEEKIKEQKSDCKFNPVYANISRGSFAMHDKRTIHGSLDNKEDYDRVCLAINIRTEDSILIPERDDAGFLDHISNPVFSPVVFHLR